MDEKKLTDMEKLIEKVSRNSNGLYDFNGWNCDCVDSNWNDGIPCTGWDGESRRCSCNNRRVSWELSDCGTYVYAEAY